MLRSLLLPIGLAALLVSDAGAQQGLEPHVFPPELVMRARQQINLTPEQRRVITGAIGEFQKRSLELEWTLQDEAAKLGELASGTRVDEPAALAQVDRVLEVEREIKRAHLRMLIGIKNALTEEQQRQLREMRHRVPEGTAPGRHPRPDQPDR